MTDGSALGLPRGGPRRRALVVTGCVVVALVVGVVAVGLVSRSAHHGVTDDLVATAEAETTSTPAPPSTLVPPGFVPMTTPSTLVPPDFVPMTTPSTLVPPGFVPITTPPPPPPPPEPVVAVYGDSLVWEARAAISQLVSPATRVRVLSQGGTALCDYSQQIVDDARNEPTRMVVVAFTGNTFTACSQRFGSTPAPAEMARLYAEDLQWVLEKLSVLGTRVLLVGAPPNIDANDVTYWTPVNAVWEDAAARWSSGGMDISYADAGAVLSEAGAWAATLPCLPSEGPERGCTDGQIAVRAPDRLHFCPTLAPTSYGVIADCPVWSSGAWRYGQAVASAVLQHL